MLLVILIMKTVFRFYKIGPSGGVLNRVLGSLLFNGLHLIGSVPKTLAKSVLIQLWLTGSSISSKCSYS